MPTLTQSETLKIGQRGEYTPSTEAFKERLAALNINCWVEKRKAKVTDADRNLRTFIDIPTGYKLEYGITFEGRDYDCGDMPRDLGRVVRGISIVKGMV